MSEVVKVEGGGGVDNTTTILVLCNLLVRTAVKLCILALGVSLVS